MASVQIPDPYWPWLWAPSPHQTRPANDQSQGPRRVDASPAWWVSPTTDSPSSARWCLPASGSVCKPARRESKDVRMPFPIPLLPLEPHEPLWLWREAAGPSRFLKVLRQREHLDQGLLWGRTAKNGSVLLRFPPHNPARLRTQEESRIRKADSLGYLGRN